MVKGSTRIFRLLYPVLHELAAMFDLCHHQFPEVTLEPLTYCYRPQ